MTREARCSIAIRGESISTDAPADGRRPIHNNDAMSPVQPPKRNTKRAKRVESQDCPRSARVSEASGPEEGLRRQLDRPPTPTETLTGARQIAVANGIRYAYTGNVHDIVGQSTYCHGCGVALIERDWYELGAWRLGERGRCAACGVPCAGVFDRVPGRWGARRLPLRLRV